MRTPAASFELDGKVDARTIYNRKRRLMSLQRKISSKRNRALIGREFTVLVEGPSADSELWSGRRGFPVRLQKLMASVKHLPDPRRCSNYAQARFASCGSRRRTIMTLTGVLLDTPRTEHPFVRIPTHAIGAMKCPICQKKVKRDDPYMPFLQRPLPDDRSSQLGV